MNLVNWLPRALKNAVIRSSLDLFREVYGGPPSMTGETVTWKTALEVSTVLACVRVLADGVCQVPCRVYGEAAGRRVVAAEHPVNGLVSMAPNGWQTSYEFWETMIFHWALLFNAYAFVNRVGSRREVRELVLIEPHRVEVRQRPNLSMEYKVRGDDGTQEIFGQDAIWHLRGPSWNGWMGMEAVKLARDAIGLSISLERGQSEFQKNGARTSGLLAIDEKLSPEKFEFLSAWLDKHMPGGERAGKPIIADQGMKYSTFSMSGVDQQLLETRKHQIEEICRGFRVMPIMVGHADKTATYASAEQMFLAHVVHTLMPLYRRIEQSADVNLLSEQDRKAGLYTKFNPNALMRGAAKDRGEFYAKALGSGGGKGWMTQNDVRALEELDRSDDPAADELAQPLGGTATPPADDPSTGDSNDP
jgi:HK97 family phage portal protein